MSKGNGKKFALGALIGVLAGFVTGILTAPKSGKETRQDIKRTANKFFIESEKKLKALQGELAVLLERGAKLAKKKSGTAKIKLDLLIKKANKAQQKTKELISAIKSGETDEPELKKAIKEVTAAKNDLLKYLKKS